MQRRLIFTIPLLVVAAVFLLNAPAFGAPQQHDHAASTGSEHACACCGNSGADATNHAAGGGCCSNMAARHTAKSEGNTSKSENGGCCAGKTAEAPPAAQMNHHGQGCCGSMAMAKDEAGAKATGDASVRSDAQAFPVENSAANERDDEEPPLE